MKWTGRRQSENVEDRRGMRPGRGMVVGGGLGGLIITLLVVFLGGDPGTLENVTQTSQPVEAPVPVNPQEEELKQFVSVVLADTEDIWSLIFTQNGLTYQKPTIVLFTGQVESACGFASSASGPFYCPPDQKVYMDLAFFEELRSRFGAPGDFAVAYVIAHEVGHHVQNLIGTADRVHQARNTVSEEEYNRLSVRLELQADFLAGVWAFHAREALGVIEAGDFEEALTAATAIGDDRLQKQSQGHVVPDAFTHGTSAQRARWFRRGFESGDLKQGDTFSLDYESL